jgi:O-antigen ligase
MLGLVVGLLIQQSLMFANTDERRIVKVGTKWVMMIVLLALSIGSYFDLVFLSDLLDQKSDSSNYRLEAFDLFITSILENPFFGAGYQNIWYETEAMFGFKMGAHNIFLGAFVDFGIFAFLILVYLFGKGFLSIRNKLRSSNIEIKFAHTVLALITALFIHGQFHEIQVNTIVWLTLLLAIFINNKSSIHSFL